MKILSFLFFFIPHPINIFLRSLLGQKVGVGAKIHIFSFIHCNRFIIGNHSSVSPFTILKANSIELGSQTNISPFTVIHSQLIKGADLVLGDFSKIFPFCWLEPGEGIFIGKNVGIGGHTLIFTHGSWSNYLKGGPVSFGPVRIEDNVWIPWRVFIMPGVTIGSDSIIGANSTVTQSLGNNVLAAGSPAKVIKEKVNTGLSQREFDLRCEDLLSNYSQFCQRLGESENLTSKDVKFQDLNISWGEGSTLLIDLEHKTFISNYGYDARRFIQFLRRYGIRLNNGTAA